MDYLKWIYWFEGLFFFPFRVKVEILGLCILVFVVSFTFLAFYLVFTFHPFLILWFFNSWISWNLNLYSKIFCSFSIFSCNFESLPYCLILAKVGFPRKLYLEPIKRKALPIRLQSAVTSFRKTEKQTNRPNRVKRSKPK